MAKYKDADGYTFKSYGTKGSLSYYFEGGAECTPGYIIEGRYQGSFLLKTFDKKKDADAYWETIG